MDCLISCVENRAHLSGCESGGAPPTASMQSVGWVWIPDGENGGKGKLGVEMGTVQVETKNVSEPYRERRDKGQRRSLVNE